MIPKSINQWKSENEEVNWTGERLCQATFKKFCLTHNIFLHFFQLLYFHLHNGCVWYPHHTRPNSGLDQIILVLKILTEPIRSWCCLHLHAKFLSAAAVDYLGPILVSQRIMALLFYWIWRSTKFQCLRLNFFFFFFSFFMSQQCLQTVCVVKTWCFHGFS